MTYYKHIDSPAVRGLEAIDVDEAARNALSFLAYEDFVDPVLRLEFLLAGITVFSFESKEKNEDVPSSGWVVGGRIPHLYINDNNVGTPLEALVIYAHLFLLWASYKGRGPDNGGFVDIRMPPDWKLLEYAGDDVKATKVVTVVNIIAFNLVPQNVEDIKDMEVRAIWERRGWLRTN